MHCVNTYKQNCALSCNALLQKRGYSHLRVAETCAPLLFFAHFSHINAYHAWSSPFALTCAKPPQVAPEPFSVRHFFFFFSARFFITWQKAFLLPALGMPLPLMALQARPVFSALFRNARQNSHFCHVFRKRRGVNAALTAPHASAPQHHLLWRGAIF